MLSPGRETVIVIMTKSPLQHNFDRAHSQGTSSDNLGVGFASCPIIVFLLFEQEAKPTTPIDEMSPPEDLAPATMEVKPVTALAAAAAALVRPEFARG